MEHPDILVFMSDQHTPLLSSLTGGPARTPSLEAMAREGASFTQAYTACPLCVPARMAMLSGRLPSRTGILTNDDTLPGTNATFVHALAAAGYETTLVGRMHFVGPDQRHGFLNRLVGDTTPMTWARPLERLRAIRGVHRDTFRGECATEIVGGGDSPVLDYDRDVVEAALAFLAKAHDKPQFVLVGTYGPHFPYVAPPDLYKKYLSLVEAPFGCRPPADMNPLLAKRAGKGFDEALAVRIRAAYCGMVERIDSQVGAVRAAFNDWLARSGRRGVFAYLSDHGDMCGERGLVGKDAFYEKSLKIPLLFAGEGVTPGRRWDAPTSVLDLGPTLCGLAGVPLPTAQDGESLAPILAGDSPKEAEGRTVTAELLAPDAGGFTFARMARQGRFKLQTYHKYEAWDALFDVEADPFEQHNLIGERPALANALRGEWSDLPKAGAVEREQVERSRNVALVSRFEELARPPQMELWGNSSEASKLPPTVI